MKLSNVATKEIMVLSADEYADMTKAASRFKISSYVGSLINHRARAIHVFFEYDINTASIEASIQLFKTLWATSVCSERRDDGQTLIVLHDPVIDYTKIPVCKEILEEKERRLIIDRAIETRIIRNEKERVVFKYVDTETGCYCKAFKEVKKD